MAARQGPVAMAAHQICLQVWLAVSLLTDALAASGQVRNSVFLKNVRYMLSEYISTRLDCHCPIKISLVISSDSEGDVFVNTDFAQYHLNCHK